MSRDQIRFPRINTQISCSVEREKFQCMVTTDLFTPILVLEIKQLKTREYKVKLINATDKITQTWAC